MGKGIFGQGIFHRMSAVETAAIRNIDARTRKKPAARNAGEQSGKGQLGVVGGGQAESEIPRSTGRRVVDSFEPRPDVGAYNDADPAHEEVTDSSIHVGSAGFGNDARDRRSLNGRPFHEGRQPRDNGHEKNPRRQ